LEWEAHKHLLPILENLPTDNALKEIVITAEAKSYESMASALDELLSERRFAQVERVDVSVSHLVEGKRAADYATYMPRTLERGILVLGEIGSIFTIVVGRSGRR
jgi:hypothetical protein